VFDARRGDHILVGRDLWRGWETSRRRGCYLNLIGISDFTAADLVFENVALFRGDGRMAWVAKRCQQVLPFCLGFFDVRVFDMAKATHFHG